MAELVKPKTEDQTIGVTRSSETKQIILPEGMSCKDGMVWLSRKDEEEERSVAIHEYVDAYPLDGALALTRAMQETYGWTNLVPTPGFFGDTPPSMVGVRTGPNPEDVVQVPWGRMEIPGVEGYISTGMSLQKGRPVFTIGGVVKRKYEKEISKLATATRKIVATDSIYRARAIRVAFPDPSDTPNPDDYNPTFLDLSSVKPEELIFPEDVKEMIHTNLFTPIERTEECRKHKIPLKRGILLAGPYGVGKTLTAYVAAKKCVENGWTFIYLESVRDLQAAIFFAQQYGPAMIFAEDIDQVLGKEDRDQATNDILNTIDGVDTKASEMIVTLTTNHVERLNQAMLRPGRLDAVIVVSEPDAKAAEKLIRMYARGLIDDSVDLTAIGEKLAGRIPAVIREVVERAKLGSIARVSPGTELAMVPADLIVAADSMLGHLELLLPKKQDKRSDREKAAEILGSHLSPTKNTVTNGKTSVPPTSPRVSA